MTRRTVLVAGAGTGLGAALARVFSENGDAVAVLARSGRIGELADVRVIRADLTRAAEVEAACNAWADEAGAIDVLIYNAAHLIMAPFLDTPVTEFESAWQTSVLGAVHCTRAVLPSMLNRGTGILLFSGATASVKAGPHAAAFGSAKFALRGLAQSLAREFQPQGIHVAHVVLDGLMAGTPSVARFGGMPETSLDPQAVANAYLALSKQDARAWTHEIDMRPWCEKF